MTHLILAGVLWSLPGQVSGLDPAVESAAKAATVRVVNRGNGGEANGVVVDRVGAFAYVLTAAHTFDKSDDLEVHLFPAKGDPRRPHVVKMVKIIARTEPEAQDLALLQIAFDPDFAPAAMPLAPTDSLPSRRPFKAYSVKAVDAVGPQVQTEAVLDGVQVRKKGSPASSWFWKVKTIPERGRSGGPLIDSEGRLIGICSGGDGAHGYYTHLSELQSLLRTNGLRFLVK